MKKVLHSEIAKEMPNKAAIGAMNMIVSKISSKGGLVVNDSRFGKQVYTYEENQYGNKFVHRNGRVTNFKLNGAFAAKLREDLNLE